MAIAGREAAHGADTFEIMLGRTAIGLIVLLAMAGTTGRFGALKTRRIGLHGLRNIVHFVGQFSWLYALPLLPLAVLFSLEFMSPLWVAVLAPLILGERLTLQRLLAAGVGFAGMLIVVRPGGLPFTTGTFFALLSAIGFALSMLATKRLTRTEPPFTILFYMQLIQTAIALVPLVRGVALLDAATLGWVTLLALFGLIAHFCQVQAFSLADAIVVAPMDFLRLPLIALVGMLVYGESLELWVLAGGGVIVLANFINMRGERKSR
jgi:drug/metabolite transporter (DMT)-like permease